MGLRNEIPQRAFINAQIVQLATETGDWATAVSSIVEQYGLGQYQFMNSAYVVSLLYCLLVVPKEIWIKKNKAHEVFREIDQEKLRCVVQDLTSANAKFDDDFAYNLIHKLRNAVSHANYEVDENMDFEFWDKYQNKVNFRCKIKSSNLMWLLSEVGAALANLRSWR